jgi:uncharacterized membrane-anchored protein
MGIEVFEMRNLPRITASYWLTLVAASTFGTNTGDFVARYLHLGHLAGLPWMGLVFAAILLLAARARRGEALYFWAAIITVRTAATNVGDAFHDFHVAYSVSLSLVLVLFAASVLVYGRIPGERDGKGTVRVNSAYWICMMLAGILGTIGGDFVSFRLGLTPLGTAAVFGCLIAASLGWFGKRGVLLDAAPYWTTVGLIRSGGTGAGDAVAEVLGLAPSTLLTGVVFVGLVLCFYAARSKAEPRMAPT